MRVPDGVWIDHPSFPLLREWCTYWNLTTAAGNAAGTSIVDDQLANEPSYLGHPVKVMTGDAAGQVRWIWHHVAGTNTIIVDAPFTDAAGAVVQIVASTIFVIISMYDSNALFAGTTTAAGLADGSTMVDTGLAVPFTVDDECIGHTVVIVDSTTAELISQARQIWDYDFGASVLYFDIPFTAQVPIATSYVILRDRPDGGGGPGPTPEPEIEEKAWQLADYDPFDVADPTADTERWSSEYISAGAADGTADIDTTLASHLYVNITAAAVLAAAEYGVRRLQRCPGKKWFTKVDALVTVTNEDANDVWAALSVSAGGAWDANNYIRIYKYQDNVPNEGIAVEYNIAGVGAVITNILATTQDHIAFKIERINQIWRTYYSLTPAPRHHWILALEIEDPTNAMTDWVSIYNSVYNPEDAVGQQIRCDFDKWELYYTLGNFIDILNLLVQHSGALAYQGYCDAAMAASTTNIVCPNLIGFPDDKFTDWYWMKVLHNNNAPGTAPEEEIRRITDYVGATGTFTVNAFSANVEAKDLVIILHESIVTIYSIFDLVNAQLTLKETGGSITTTGGVDTMYIVNVPVGVFSPKRLEFDTSNMIAGDAIEVSLLKRIVTGGALTQKTQVVFNGAQVDDIKEIMLGENRFGVQVTIQRTAGVDRAFPWAVFWED